MTTETANALIEVAKILMDKTYRLPPIGAQSSLTLFSEQSRKETFTVHINRKARIDPGKYTLLLSVPEEGLLRIDVHGRDHINPDGSKVPCPHIHMRIKDTGKWDVWAYDYMPAFLTNVGYNQKIQDENVIKTANVFTNNTDKEYAVCAVSTKTASHRARVEYILYRLGEDARNPEDGELIGKRVAYYDYAGFHRESLNGSVPIKPGERIAVVAIETVTDKNGEKKYEFAANQATSQNQSMTPYYGIAVVNKGESFIFRDGEWTDWSEYDDKYSDALYAEMSRQGITDVSEAIVTDNFSIKLYVVTDA